MRFELIDQVLERAPDRLTAIKNVTTAEEYLGDHFPGFPVLPGVMMLETLVQAARLLADAEATSPCESAWVVREVRNVRYGQMVRPGQTLEVEVTLRSRDDAGCEFQGKGTVAGQVAVQGRFRLAPLAERTQPGQG
ncbi:3-hydroxyacyl-ACP dehydratase FabZ family protein [Phycisphaerales bacterium AB-hyl4]|uniref:3-hydroxyacyl-ACP dehydratase FabZ family protein n=1 Tax=Natronomicrosphaera hydrolytica TaxID=3242702 RepID=A0ABV4U254_9BACT